MSIAHAAPPVTARRVSRLFMALLAVAAVLVARFVFKYVVPYLSLDRAITQHREWMIRSYVVTMALVFFRVGYEVLERYNVAQPQRSMMLAWGCWAVPLLLTEPVLQLRHVRKRHSAQGVERHA